MNQYKFSIITVCYNAEKFISETIKSLTKQSFKDYEYIIKDGGSTDKTLEYAYALTGDMKNAYIVSEKDKGIYDAMNIAVGMAKGEYIYFLNAGDYFIDNFVLEKTAAFIESHDDDVVYGNAAMFGQGNYSIKKYGRICSKKLYFLSGDCICHQAMFAKWDLFRKKQFNLNYKVCADKEWQLFFLSQGRSFESMNFEIAVVLTDGFSKEHIKDFENETYECLDIYCKRYKWVYGLILLLKRKYKVLSFFRYVEKKFFYKS
nr:glycosyltransferase family 2 protein [uncultured Eisenbergiella sp.]